MNEGMDERSFYRVRAGGGKGMRVAEDEADLREKYQACINEVREDPLNKAGEKEKEECVE